MPFLYGLVSVIVVSLISLVGVFTLSIKEHFLRRIIFILVSLSVGVLFGDVFVHLLPEIFEGAEEPITISLFILFGIMIFFVLEKFLLWRHYHDHGLAVDCDMHPQHEHSRLGPLIFFSDGVHNFLDGFIIAAGYSLGLGAGIATTLAVILHEIPQEIGDFGVLIHAGYSRAKALLLNFASGLFAVVGLLFAFVIGDYIEGFTVIAASIAAGGFIYIAAADLVPELHKITDFKRSFIQFVSIGVGVALMFLLVFLE